MSNEAIARTATAGCTEIADSSAPFQLTQGVGAPSKRRGLDERLWKAVLGCRPLTQEWW